MSTYAITSFFPFPHVIACLILALQLQEHVLRTFHYLLAECDIIEIMFTDMWPSVEDFIGYMGQDGISIGEVIPGTITRKPPPTATIYSSAVLDAMDGGVLPLDYRPSGPGIGGSQAQPGLVDENGDVNGDSDNSDDDASNDRDNSSILTEFDGEPLPLYNSKKPPVYCDRSIQCYDTDVLGPSLAPSETPPAPPIVEGTTNPRSRSKHNPFSQLRPRLAPRLQRIKEKFSPSKKPDKIAEQPETSREPFSRRVREKLTNSHALDAVSPKRAVKRARRFITLGRCQV